MSERTDLRHEMTVPMWLRLGLAAWLIGGEVAAGWTLVALFAWDLVLSTYIALRKVAESEAAAKAHKKVVPE